ncbi:hypothetical protein [Aliiglaciecola sp. M165]|uniref:hypothetical protein n=1 Tax=Aliiglaciecola sp. M165 TaxID=2593649 RepID=UPI00117CE524|nr:hypothetical protein [Aliiglaciecola sp. M165]TRY33399.1 hypothetical protein FM019_05340 [Aliiglaciecola sp. M165]
MRVIVYLSVFLLTTVSAYSDAAFRCTGKITEIHLRHSGGVSIRSEGMWGGSSVGRDICNVSSEWNGVALETCKIWLSTALAAKARDIELSIQYTNDDYNCETMPTWTNAIKPHAIISK